MMSIACTFREGREALALAARRAAVAAHPWTAEAPDVPPTPPVQDVSSPPDVETCSLEEIFLYDTHVLFLGYKGHPWTREALLMLGLVFIRVHGRLLRTPDLAREHFMPSDTALRTHFGCLSGYNAALVRLGTLSKEEELDG